MKKKILFAIAVMICSFGFSQNGKATVKIFIGNTLCGENVNVEMQRSQLLKEGKLTIVVSDKDTITNMSFTLQMMKSDYLTEKIKATNSVFPVQAIRYLKPNDTDLKVKKIWVENISIEYKDENVKLPMFTIIVKD
ncbi:MAG: hypothetical protein ACOYMA_03665 [Bacteroidia bacterium]